MNQDLDQGEFDVRNIFEIKNQIKSQDINFARVEAVKNRVSPQTLRALKADWKVWLNFCNKRVFGLSAL